MAEGEGVILAKELKHDADAVHLAEGWIGLCATCGWVGHAYGSRDQARAESTRHVADAAADGGTESPDLGPAAAPFRDRAA